MVLRFCANLSFMFTENSNLLERYSLASRAGFKAVEFAFPYDYSIDDIVNAKNAANVDQILINAYPGNLENGDLGLAAIPGRQAEFKESLDTSITYALALNCKKMHIMAGKCLSGIVDTAMDDVYKDNLQYAAHMLEEKGIVGLIEPITRIAVPNYYMHSFSQALEIVKSIDSDSLKLQLDIFHLQMLEGNLTNNLRELLPYTGHIQISQAPNRHEPGTPGEIDYNYILHLLEDMDYQGYIGLEYKPKVDTITSLQWMEKWGYQL